MIVLMTLMVPRLLPFSGKNLRQKTSDSTTNNHLFIKDITTKQDDEEVDKDALEDLEELDDILSTPLRAEQVELNQSRLKRMSRMATKEVDLHDYSTVKKNITARKSRKNRATGKNIDLSNMVSHLAGGPLILKEQVKETSSSENEEVQLPVLPPVIKELTKDETDTNSEADTNKLFLNEDIISEGTEDPETQFLEDSDVQTVHESKESLLQTFDHGHYSILDHLDSSILLTEKKMKKVNKKKPVAS